MFTRILLALFILFSLTSSAQEIDMSAFSEKVKVVNNAIPLSEMRESQKGVLMSYNYSFGPWSHDFKFMYVKESIIPFGIYTGFGITQVFTYTSTSYESGYFIPISYSELKNSFYDKRFYNYVSIGASKNLTMNQTIYAGYARILGVDREEKYFPYVTNYLEQDIIDFGYIYRGRKMSFSLGLPIHLPYYDFDTFNEDNLGDVGGIKIKPQIGIGYNF